MKSKDQTMFNNIMFEEVTYFEILIYRTYDVPNCSIDLNLIYVDILLRS